MKLIKILCLLSLVWVFVSSCDKDDDQPVATNNIDTLISADPTISIFKALLAKANLRTFSRGAGPYTFLVPTNDAFKAAGISNEADVNNIPLATAVTVVTYHFLSSNVKIIDIPVGPNATTITQAGANIYVSKYGADTYINGAKIVKADIAASNGTMHVIDKVLTPPLNNTVTTLSQFPEFRLLVQAVNRAGIAATVNTAGATILAPDNNAFVAAGLDSATIANTAATTLSNILRYHIIQARLFSSDFKTGTYKTVQGGNVSVDVSGGVKVKGATNPAPFSVTGSDMLTSTGVLHSINGVLKP